MAQPKVSGLIGTDKHRHMPGLGQHKWPVPSSRIEDVDEEFARYVLENWNKHNRPISDSIVSYYQGIIERDDWDLTHEGIAFDWDGVLIDGQHRLFAILYSGKAVKMMVTRGLDPKVQLVIDQGYVRRPHHQLTLAGDPTTGMMVAVARAMQGGMAGRQAGARDIHSLKRFIDRHRTALEFACHVFKSNIKGITQAPVRAAIARAWYVVAPETLQRFAHVLATGFMEGGETGAVVLRTFLMTNSPSTSNAAAILIYGKTERAIDAFVKRRRLTRIVPVESELYPLPEETERKVSPQAAKKAARKGRKVKTAPVEDTPDRVAHVMTGGKQSARRPESRQ